MTYAFPKSINATGGFKGWNEDQRPTRTVRRAIYKSSSNEVFAKFRIGYTAARPNTEGSQIESDNSFTPESVLHRFNRQQMLTTRKDLMNTSLTVIAWL